ncbi:MAG TPA: HAD family hydrolase [Pyrinomonadaceae bacterium]|jgi:putative hydrolase of the HAD superfamily
MIKTIAFDADDTLWHNERMFVSIKEKYQNLLAAYHDADWVEQRLDEAETRNIPHFGYGVKGFALSLIETAVELTEGRITGSEIMEIVGYAREMLTYPVELLEGVKETIEDLSRSYNLMVITKGDLFDQEGKLARSGIGDCFKAFEIIPQKNAKTYKYILRRHQIEAEEFVMVGNSLKSDILPVIEIGARAVHIPYEIEWFHEMVSDDELRDKDFARIEKMSELPRWLSTF